MPSENTPRLSAEHNCAQAVFSAFAPRFGLPEETALKIAAPFGGGMARQGHVCGAVTGGLMALGLRHGHTRRADQATSYRLGQALIRQFEAHHGSVLCRDLIGCDLTTPLGLANALRKGVFKKICPNLVRDAIAMVSELLDEA